MFQQLVLFTSFGTLQLQLNKDVKLELQLTVHECDLLRSMCERMYAERQMALANIVATPLPALADFTEVGE